MISSWFGRFPWLSLPVVTVLQLLYPKKNEAQTKSSNAMQELTQGKAKRQRCYCHAAISQPKLTSKQKGSPAEIPAARSSLICQGNGNSLLISFNIRSYPLILYKRYISLFEQRAVLTVLTQVFVAENSEITRLAASSYIAMPCPFAATGEQVPLARGEKNEMCNKDSGWSKMIKNAKNIKAHCAVSSGNDGKWWKMWRQTVWKNGSWWKLLWKLLVEIQSLINDLRTDKYLWRIKNNKPKGSSWQIACVDYLSILSKTGFEFVESATLN